MIRVGVDFGGTKIEAAALDSDGQFRSRVRAPNPRDYDAALGMVRDLVAAAEREAGARVDRVGVAMPGSMSRATGLARNANSTMLNGRSFDRDLAEALGREVRVANDANCFALSEAADGAGAGAGVVFGVILGTGCGGGVTAAGRLLTGVNGVAGEWGHTPLPWPTAGETEGPACWCGRRGCLETWISGPAFARDYAAGTGRTAEGEAIVERARAGEPQARAALDRYVDRLGRGLAVVCDILDPDVVVLGGGMSNIDELYAAVGPVIARNLFSDACATRVLRARHGDSSGVRGAAWLWPLP